MRTVTATAAALLVLVSAAPTPAAAQDRSIDPGMTKEQVVERLGAPATERSRGTFTYLFYVNGMERQMGMNDLVVLENNRVVDAIFRSPQRTYTGASSSPRPIPAAEAHRRAPPSPPPLQVPPPTPPPPPAAGL